MRSWEGPITYAVAPTSYTATPTYAATLNYAAAPTYGAAPTNYAVTLMVQDVAQHVPLIETQVVERAVDVPHPQQVEKVAEGDHETMTTTKATTTTTSTV